MRERISSTKKLKTSRAGTGMQTGGTEVEKIKNRTERGIESVMPNAPDTQDEFIKAFSRFTFENMLQGYAKNY